MLQFSRRFGFLWKFSVRLLADLQHTEATSGAWGGVFAVALMVRTALCEVPRRTRSRCHQILQV